MNTEMGNNSTKTYEVYIMYKALWYELWQIKRRISFLPSRNYFITNLLYIVIEVIKERFYELQPCFENCECMESPGEIIKNAGFFSLYQWSSDYKFIIHFSKHLQVVFVCDPSKNTEVNDHEMSSDSRATHTFVYLFVSDYS